MNLGTLVEFTYLLPLRPYIIEYITSVCTSAKICRLFRVFCCRCCCFVSFCFLVGANVFFVVLLFASLFIHTYILGMELNFLLNLRQGLGTHLVKGLLYCYIIWLILIE